MASLKNDLWPSLGGEVCDWIETYLWHGPGDVQDQPLELDDEFRAFIWRAYEVYPKGHPLEGRRRYHRAFLSRPKGRAKSELAGAIACAEALGPVRFDGWRRNKPVGRPVTAPWVRCFATEEGQAGNTFDNVVWMLENGAAIDEYDGLDVGITRVNLPAGGSIEAVTSAAGSKDGGKDTFDVFDEALSLDVRLPTPTGWTTMAAVAAGDWLIGSDGRPVQVLKATPVQYGRQCYRVTFEDGTDLVASDGHQWMTCVRGSAAGPRVRTTGEMVEDGRSFRVPTHGAWDLPEAQLPVDPYLLGLWLGDGSKGQCYITAGIEDAPEVMSQLARRGIATWPAYPKDRPVRVAFSRRTGFQQGTALGASMAGLACFRDKHVPPEYLRSSIYQRSELVRGLMDSDGHCSSTGHCTFVGTERLALDLLALLRSLGQVATRRWCPDKRSRSGGSWKVHFTARRGFEPFALPRKATRVVQHHRGPDWVTIRSIEPVTSEPVRCVAVDADDHLFQAGDGCHVTHNTHLWTTRPLRQLHDTVTRNLSKRRAADGWALETSTMYGLGEGSVAEATHTYARQGDDDGLLFDHRQAPDDIDLADDEAVLGGLRHVYGPAAAWMDLGGIVKREFRNPAKTEADNRRYWFNQPVKLARRLFDPTLLSAIERPARHVEPGARIVLGFNGTPNHDATSVVAWTVEDRPHLFTIKIWPTPVVRDLAHTVSSQEVDAVIRDAFGRYDVARMACIVLGWRAEIEAWTAAFGDEMVVAFDHNQPSKMAPATDRLDSAIKQRAVTWDGDEDLRSHLLRCDRKDSHWGPLAVRPEGGGEEKIDAALAAIISYAEVAHAGPEKPQVAPQVHSLDEAAARILARRAAENRSTPVPGQVAPVAQPQRNGVTFIRF